MKRCSGDVHAFAQRDVAPTVAREPERLALRFSDAAVALPNGGAAPGHERVREGLRDRRRRWQSGIEEHAEVGAERDHVAGRRDVGGGDALQPRRVTPSPPASASWWLAARLGRRPVHPGDATDEVLGDDEELAGGVIERAAPRRRAARSGYLRVSVADAGQRLRGRQRRRWGRPSGSGTRYTCTSCASRSCRRCRRRRGTTRRRWVRSRRRCPPSRSPSRPTARTRRASDRCRDREDARGVAGVVVHPVHVVEPRAGGDARRLGDRVGRDGAGARRDQGVGARGVEHGGFGGAAEAGGRRRDGQPPRPATAAAARWTTGAGESRNGCA